jgi:hypothetical protein
MMGVERAVMRWYAQRQLIELQIAQLNARLIALEVDSAANAQEVEPEVKQELQQALAKAREQLLLLGPCPQSSMV